MCAERCSCFEAPGARVGNLAKDETCQVTDPPCKKRKERGTQHLVIKGRAGCDFLSQPYIR